MSRSRGERRLEHAAELMLEREIVPGPAPVPDFSALLAARVRRSRRRAAALALVAAVAIGGGAGTFRSAGLDDALAFFDRRPISYAVAGSAAVRDGGVEATSSSSPSGAQAPAQLRFSEGTEVTLGAGARLSVAARTRHGALLELEQGQARFQVVHRRGARWSVVAGPFVVEVTGTEFTVDWSPRTGRMMVELLVGSVRVGGASVGGTVELHAGERLVATAADHRLTLGPEAGPGDRSREENEAVAFGAPTSAPPATTTREPSRMVVDGAWGRQRSLPAAPALLALRSPHQSPPSAAPELPETPVPVLDGNPIGTRPIELRGPRLDPLPVEASRSSSVPQSLIMGGGGLFCVTVPAQYSFEDVANGLSAASAYTLALSRPRIDRTHSWCGEASVRMDASFDERGRRNFFGRYLDETGQLVVRLDRPTDLTGKTVTMHVFVEGPSDVRFTAEIAAVQHGGWASSPPVQELAPGRWWTISHRFDVENPTGVRGSSNPLPYPNGGVSSVAETDRLALAIHTTGDRRAWKGSVYVDDIAW